MMKYLTYALIFLSLSSTAWAESDPVSSDSRIKTFVYNENDVYPITALFGYQSNVEFSLKETIETISLGDRIGWQIIPSGRRLFIRALTENVRTNMTVITNKRAYQFDLRAVSGSATRGEELVYVARFYYPGEQPRPVVTSIQSADLQKAAALTSGYNFNYTFSGPDTVAPTKIFDDGSSTYFKFRDPALSPSVSLVAPDGTEKPIPTRTADGYIAVSTTAPRFSLRAGSQVVCVFNEAEGK